MNMITMMKITKMDMIIMMKITKMTMRIRRRMFSEDAQLQSYAVCGQRMAEPQNG